MRLSSYWDEKGVSKNIQEHEALEWFAIEQVKNEDSSKMWWVQILSPEWEALSPLEISFRTPDDINNQYKQEKIDAEEVARQLKQYEDGRESLQQTLDELWYEWIKWIYNSIHWWHRIYTLAPQSLNLDPEKDYYTSSKLSLDKESISYLWTFWDKSLFISPWTKFWDMSMRWFSQWIFVIAISEEWEMYTAHILWWDMTSEEDADIYKHNGHLLLSTSRKPFLSWQHDILRILVSPDGTLWEGLFNWWEINISETEDWVKRKREDILDILELEW